MKPKIYEKMQSLFHLIEHNYQDSHPVELILFQLARGNTFNTRVVGLEAIKRFRREHPDCAVTFKPTHFSEADFILLGLLFRENGMRVLTEGGANLFIEDTDIYQDLLPEIVHPGLRETIKGMHMSVADFFSSHGAFKVFREPVTMKQEDDSELKIGIKESLLLSQAYRQHLVRNREMYVTFPGYSRIKSGLLDMLKKEDFKMGRCYTGKIDGFHHSPFKMDIEASQETGVDVYVVGINIAYSPVIEDEHFAELIELHEQGVDRDEIYRNDLSYILKAFYQNSTVRDLSIKFSEPVKIDTAVLQDGRKGIKAKKLAQMIAKDTFDKILEMQPVFPANVYFSCFDRKFGRMPIRKMTERIDEKRDYLQTLLWGKEKKRIDLHYILDYRNQIMSAEEIINRTFEKFSTYEKKITARDGDGFVVLKPDVAIQYQNHTAHFF